VLLCAGLSSLDVTLILYVCVCACVCGFVRSTRLQVPLRAEERETAHTRDATCVAFGQRKSDVVVTGSVDGTVRVWDLSEYTLLRAGVAGGVPVACVAFDDSDGTVFAGYDDGFLRCFEPSGVRPHATVRRREHRAAAARVPPRVATCCRVFAAVTLVCGVAVPCSARRGG
jgi:WD40 repeat protein